jgi:hypothetical protein
MQSISLVSFCSLIEYEYMLPILLPDRIHYFTTRIIFKHNTPFAN